VSSVATLVTNLQRRLKKLEVLLTDPSGLVPNSKKWFDYWECWLVKLMSDPDFRPREKMPLAAFDAILARLPASRF
jgi:hypothetical protein